VRDSRRRMTVTCSAPDALWRRWLTPAQATVAELVAGGMSNKQAALAAGVTEQTIKFHLTDVYSRLKVETRAQLIRWWIEHVELAEARRNGYGSRRGRLAAFSYEELTELEASLPMGMSLWLEVQTEIEARKPDLEEES
jgi:DNA-binding CsgD family transcriptional regulator